MNNFIMHYKLKAFSKVLLFFLNAYIGFKFMS